MYNCHHPIALRSVTMEKATKQQHIPPCEGGEMSEKLKSMVEYYLARQVAKAPVAEVGGNDTVH